MMNTVGRGVATIARNTSTRAMSRPIPHVPVKRHNILAMLPPRRAAAIRHSSHSPLGSPPISTRPKITLTTLRNMYKKGEPITMLTAYDFATAHAADHGEMDMVLVGDSLAMVSLGLHDTSEVTLEEMIMCSRAVSRGVSSAFTVNLCFPSIGAVQLTFIQVGDLPMGSYEISKEHAIGSAFRMLKEGRMQAIKLEGGASMAPTIQALTNAGVLVLAHVGLTPQRQHALGGLRIQGKTATSAMSLLNDALAVQQAGAFAVVLEAVPEAIAAMVTKRLQIPTIGIGSGKGTSGQVLVLVDMLGNYPPGRYLPKFVKTYADVWNEARKGIETYRKEVKSREYPAAEHCYTIKEEEVHKFAELLKELDEAKEEQ